jgi:ABC-type multidrug transport system permease subunit
LVLGFKLRMWNLLGRGLCHLTHTLSIFFLFALVIFQIEFHVFPWGWPWIRILLPIASCIDEIVGICHHAWFIGWDGISLTFCQGWPQTSSLLSS